MSAALLADSDDAAAEAERDGDLDDGVASARLGLASGGLAYWRTAVRETTEEAGLVLAIMVLPTVAAVSQDALRLVPYRVKEAAYGMGTTRWEAIFKVMLPAAATGIFGALVLGFGRALGETMALAMLIGNSNQISLSLFSPANTLAALLALIGYSNNDTIIVYDRVRETVHQHPELPIARPTVTKAS